MRSILFSALLLLFILCSQQPTVVADYTLNSLVPTDYGWEGQLKLSSPGPFGNDIPLLNLSVWFETAYRVRVSLRDSAKQRWEIPASFLSIPSMTPPFAAPVHSLYSFTFTPNPFTFAVTRSSSGYVLFNSSASLHYAPQYIEFANVAVDPSAPLYGLGERIIDFKLPTNDFVIWNNDWGNPTLRNLYGHHPVYYGLEPGDTVNSHAVVLWNSNMMDVNLSASSLTYKVIGGIIDLYFLLGPTPLIVTEQYTEMVGRPFMPPLYSLGWHQCKWGYYSANYTLDVVLNYTAADIPLDVIWNDIDWMRDYVAFTYNDRYGSGGFLPQDVSRLNEYLAQHHQHHIHIVDPNIPAVLVEKDQQEYLPYTTGKAMGIFVRHPANDSLLYGKQWPPMTVAWPDWTHPDVVDWWTENFRRFGQIAGMPSGIWLDMNEPSAFCAGQITASCIGNNDSSRTIDPEAVPHAINSNPTDIPYPPYQPGKQWQGLEDHSFNISSWHYMGQHYNVKEFWGMMEQRATALALMRLTGKRAFTLSRSTFMGSGHWGAHWLGDNDSDWEQIKQSIASVLAMGLYGVPMIGADVCGFGGDTTAELCARWIQLGALYPFARDHSSIGSKDQEAYRFGEPYTSLNRNSIKLRYSLLPYLYSLYVEAAETGHPVWRSLMMEYPQDPATWALDRQFMLGRALMGVPILDEGQDGVDGYLPNDSWYNYFTYTRLTSFNDSDSGAGQTYSFCSSLSDTAHVPLIQRGGTVVHTQQPKSTTFETWTTPYSLRVALDAAGSFRGSLYLDDGESIDAPHWSLQTSGAVFYSNGKIAGSLQHDVLAATSYDLSALYVEAIVIAGLDVPEGSSVPLPVLTVEQRRVELTGVSVAVRNGAVVLTDSSASIIPVGASWELTWMAEAADDIPALAQA